MVCIVAAPTAVPNAVEAVDLAFLGRVAQLAVVMERLHARIRGHVLNAMGRECGPVSIVEVMARLNCRRY